MSEEVQLMYMPSNPEDIKKINQVIKDISDQMTMIEAKRDYIKEAKKAMKEEFELPVKTVNLMIKLFHEQNSDAYFEAQRELEELYDTLFGKDE